jgi:CBS domain containing-hemolysin-like protein
MVDFIFAVILLLITVLAIELRKIYHEIPKKELRYRAVHDDQLAQKLYRAAVYGPTLDAFLWIVIILSSAGSLVLINRFTPLFIGFILVALVIWYGFTWLPRSKASKYSVRLVALVTPSVAFMLNYLHPLVQGIAKITRYSQKSDLYNIVYDKKGMSELIERQKLQLDNRIPEEELEIILRSMKLSDIRVSQVCVPWSKVKTVSSQDAIGPVLLTELHQSGQAVIPVKENSKSKELVGILNLRRLDINSTSKVAEVMETPPYYIHEEDNLASALKSFATTNSPIFIVVDKKQHHVGMLQFNDIIEQLVGHIPGDQFDQFSSKEAVANKYSKNE